MLFGEEKIIIFECATYAESKERLCIESRGCRRLASISRVICDRSKQLEFACLARNGSITLFFLTSLSLEALEGLRKGLFTLLRARIIRILSGLGFEGWRAIHIDGLSQLSFIVVHVIKKVVCHL